MVHPDGGVDQDHESGIRRRGISASPGSLPPSLKAPSAFPLDEGPQGLSQNARGLFDARERSRTRKQLVVDGDSCSHSASRGISIVIM